MSIDELNLKQKILLILVFISIVLFMWFFIELLLKSDPKISASIIGGMFTIILGISVVLLTQYQIRRRNIEEAHREKKVKIYSDFLNIVKNLFQQNNSNSSNVKKISDKKLVDFMATYKTNIILWGSPEVLIAQAEYESKSQKGKNSFLELDNLYRAIREDIGLTNRGLKPLHFIKMYLSDPDELDNLMKKDNITK